MKALILLNGNPPSEEILHAYSDGCVVYAADGSYRYAVENRVEVDVFVGDNDSFHGEVSAKRVLQFDPIKNSTDGQLCVEDCAAQGITEVVFLGAEGGREDHFLGNLGLMKKASKLGMRAVMHTSTCSLYSVFDSITLSVEKGAQISLVPFGEDAHILKAQGLFYNADGLTLTADDTRGISNVATDTNISVQLQSGFLLVCVVKGGCE